MLVINLEIKNVKTKTQMTILSRMSKHKLVPFPMERVRERLFFIQHDKNHVLKIGSILFLNHNFK